MSDLELHRSVEAFLHRDAELLDDWRLEDWIDLFEPDGRYEVPSTTSPESDASSAQFLIADDHERLLGRIQRLQSANAHAERPRSRLSHQISNIRVTRAAGCVSVRADGTTWRFRTRESDCYVVRYRHRLVERGDGFRFGLRRVEIVNERLAPGGRLSFIL